MIKPRVLLLDEPFSALDKNLRGSMQVELREIQRRLGVTTIFVTHDQGEALSLSDRVAVMSDGRILEVGTPEAIYSRPHDRFVASFVGDANVVRGRLEHFEGGEAIVRWGKGLIRASGAPLAQTAPAAAIHLFLRPEQISVATPDAANFATGKIAGRVFQGGYCDLYVESETCVSGRLIARVPAHDAAAQYPGGAEIGLSLNCDRVIAFAAA